MHSMRRAWWAIGWFGVALVIYLSLIPEPPSIDIAGGDKLEHIAAYAVLMFWFAHLGASLRDRWVTAIALVRLGVVIEFAQRATGYRDFEIADMVAGAIGVSIGWLAAPPRLPDLLASPVASWAPKTVRVGGDGGGADRERRSGLEFRL